MTQATSSADRLPDVPEGWRVVETRGPLGFTTHAVLERPDGTRVEWTSRRHRKRLGLRGPTASRGARPSASSCWVGALFAIGSACFGVASLPSYFDALSPAVVAWTFFIGSIFFTSAGYLQYHEVIHAPDGVLDPTSRRRPLEHLFGWQPHRIDFWATLVQLVGTVLFNISTFSGTRADLDVDRARHLVWAPDVYGSICFLIASWLAYGEVNRGAVPRPDGSVGWWIASLNMLGSIAFGASAIGARYVGSSGAVANITLVNLGTFLGAACFFVGAVLLPVESVRDRTAMGSA